MSITSFFCLTIPYKYYHKCCYACFCERRRKRETKGVRESFYLCMNSNHSAGEGRLGGRWEGVYIAGGRERDAK